MATTEGSTTDSNGDSPEEYPASSPSPTISTSHELLKCPSFDRSVSGSEYSDRLSAGSSRTSNVSSTSTNSSRRRGYARPQGATFAESARNRDSVMSLGSIAHLQYYFARTGLLDGKGAQLARERRKPGVADNNGGILDSTTTTGSPRISSGSTFDDGGFPRVGEDDEEEYEFDYEIDPMMLPPTVSTYNHKEQYIAPPPDTETLRRDLLDSLKHVTTTLTSIRTDKTDREAEQRPSRLSTSPQDTLTPSQSPLQTGQRSPSRGWHEMQGMHVLDVITFAIKAAKDYYTMHEHPLRLNKVKSERQIREELLSMLDVLRRMGTRNFAGGMREEEITASERWVSQVKDFLAKEKLVEAQELKDRQSWKWLEGDWPVGDRTREWQFLQTFLTSTMTPDYQQDLPPWTNPSSSGGPTPFLSTLSNGLLLVQLHNTMLKKTKRHYGEIKTWHTDFTQHYRAAENLRFWIKASELRWETKLHLDVMALVYDRNMEVWGQFDAALLQWCKAVREEITMEWKVGTVCVGGR